MKRRRSLRFTSARSRAQGEALRSKASPCAESFAFGAGAKLPRRKRSFLWGCLRPSAAGRYCGRSPQEIPAAGGRRARETCVTKRPAGAFCYARFTCATSWCNTKGCFAAFGVAPARGAGGRMTRAPRPARAPFFGWFKMRCQTQNAKRSGASFAFCVWLRILKLGAENTAQNGLLRKPFCAVFSVWVHCKWALKAAPSGRLRRPYGAAFWAHLANFLKSWIVKWGRFAPPFYEPRS